MRFIVILTSVALLAIYAGVKLAMPSQTLRQSAQASSADLTHPPTLMGSPAAITAPENGKRPRNQSN